MGPRKAHRARKLSPAIFHSAKSPKLHSIPDCSTCSKFFAATVAVGWCLEDPTDIFSDNLLALLRRRMNIRKTLKCDIAARVCAPWWKLSSQLVPNDSYKLVLFSEDAPVRTLVHEMRIEEKGLPQSDYATRPCSFRSLRVTSVNYLWRFLRFISTWQLGKWIALVEHTYINVGGINLMLSSSGWCNAKCTINR